MSPGPDERKEASEPNVAKDRQRRGAPTKHFSPYTVARLTEPFDVAFALPGSKSIANRAIVAACLGHGEVVIEHATACDDVVCLVEGMQCLGFDIDWIDRHAGRLRVRGGMPTSDGANDLDGGMAGTATRFLISVAACTPGTWTITGDPRMRRRPVATLVRAWQSLGVPIEYLGVSGDELPVMIKGGELPTDVEHHVVLEEGASSQFLTSMLLVGSVIGGLEITTRGEVPSIEYVDLTIDVLSRFGRTVERSGKRWRVGGETRSSPAHYAVEGDWSAAGAFTVLAEMTGSRFVGTNLSAESRQADRAVIDHVRALCGDGDRVLDLSATPDQFMNLAVLAARRPGRTRFVGLANLRTKECDRLAVTVRELRRAVVDIRETVDGVDVVGPATLWTTRFDPERDHRMVMAFAVLGAISVDMAIDDPECVAKSYPHFFDDLERLYDHPSAIAVVGMRAAGKSTFARHLGRVIDRDVVDLDEAFEAEHGSITSFVESHGWERFRAAESEVLRRELRPGRIVATGGGVVDHEESIAQLRDGAFVVWIDTPIEIIRERLADDENENENENDGRRPSLTGAPPTDEVEEVLQRRRPIYADLSDVRLAADVDLDEQVRLVREEASRRCTW